MLSVFLLEPSAADCRSLRRVICSGESLSAELQCNFQRTLHVALPNLYGPTEADVDATYWECPAHADLASVPIGKPIWNTHAYVLDPGLEPVPSGLPGGLYIAGAGFARGYLRRGALPA